jgi:hypothetical protein
MLGAIIMKAFNIVSPYILSTTSIPRSSKPF